MCMPACWFALLAGRYSGFKIETFARRASAPQQCKSVVTGFPFRALFRLPRGDQPASGSCTLGLPRGGPTTVQSPLFCADTYPRMVGAILFWPALPASITLDFDCRMCFCGCQASGCFAASIRLRSHLSPPSARNLSRCSRVTYASMRT